VAAENYYQHAEHYFRVIAAAQEQFRQSQPYYQQQQPGEMRGADESYDDGDGEQPHLGGEPFAPREPQPYHPREQHHNQQHNQQQNQQHNQPHYQPQQQQQQHQQPHFQPRSQHSAPENQGDDVDRLPSFITGGQPQHQQPQQGNSGPHGQNGPNGY